MSPYTDVLASGTVVAWQKTMNPKKVTLAVTAALLGLMAAACARPYLVADVARSRARVDLHCPSEQLTVARTTDTGSEYLATGCGKRAFYKCAEHGRMVGIGNGSTEYEMECFQE